MWRDSSVIASANTDYFPQQLHSLNYTRYKFFFMIILQIHACDTQVESNKQQLIYFFFVISPPYTKVIRIEIYISYKSIH